MSAVYPTLFSQLVKIRSISSFQSSEGRILAAALADNISSRFCTDDSVFLGQMSLNMIASFLDPRFKPLRFVSTIPDVEDNIIATIMSELEKIEEAAGEDNRPNTVEREVSAKKPKLYELETDGNDQDMPHRLSLEEEVSRYRTVKVVADQVTNDVEPLVWWKHNESLFPRIARLARRYLGIPATSATAERIFSRMGLLLRENRMSLLPENANSIPAPSPIANQEMKGCWNQYILENVVGRAYAKMVDHLKESNLSFHAYLESLPKFKTLPENSVQHVSVASLVTRGLMDSLKGTNWLPNVASDNSLQLFLTSNEVLNFVSKQKTLSMEQHIVLYDLSVRLGLKLTQLPLTYAELWRSCGTGIDDLKPGHLVECLGQLPFLQPVKIEKTVFRRSADLVTFLEWASKDLTSHPNPNSLPIFLSAGGNLQKNTSKKLYSSSFKIFEIFPKLADKILNTDVEKLLQTLKITCVMSLDEFLSCFSQYFPEYCQGRSFKMKPGSERWLRLTWDFLARHQEKIKDHANFKDFSIILCEDKNKKNVLVPLSEGNKCVFSRHRNLRIGSVEIKTNQFHGLYQLSNKLFRLNPSTTERANFACQLVIGSELNESQQVHLLHVINENSTLDSFDASSKEQLYKYFRDTFCARNDCLSPNDFQKLRTLPIFEVLPSDLESLDDGSSPGSSIFTVYSVPVSLPLDGLNLVRSLADKFVRAEEDSAGLDFQRNLGIVSQTVPQIYVERIIPLLFIRFEWKDLKKHLQFLQEYMISKTENWERDALLVCLKNAEFIQNENRKFFKPSMLFDPDCFLYQKFRSESLLPRCYDDVKSLLILCGLSHQITKEEFWSFTGCHAAELMNQTRQSDDHLKVFEALLENFERLELQASEFRRFQSMAIFQTMNRVFKPLNETFRYHHRTLVKHVAPCLSQSYDKALAYFSKNLPPSIENFYCQSPNAQKVVDNLKILLQRDTHSDCEVIKCLDFVFKNMGDNSQIKQQLSSLPFVSSNNYPSGKLTPKMTCKSFKCDICFKVNDHSSHPEGDSHLLDCPLRQYINEPSDCFCGMWTNLEVLGATVEPSLQQVVYALAKFYEEMSAGELWTKNPNMKKKFSRLQTHLFSKMQIESPAIEGLDRKCPIYAAFQDGQLRRINEGTIIDDANLFDKVRASNGENEPLLQSSEIVKKLSVSEISLLKKLPTALKPRFFTEIIHRKIDESTFDEGNVANELLRIKEVTAKLSKDQFLKKVVHVINFFGQSSSNFLRLIGLRCREERENAIVADLAGLKLLKLTAVRKLWFRFQIERSQGTLTDKYEDSLDFELDKHIVFACPFLGEISKDSQLDNQYHNERSNVLTTVTFLMFSQTKFFLDSREVEFLCKLLFDCHTEEEEVQAMEEAGFPEMEIFSFPDEYQLIGKRVPYSAHALLEYDPLKSFIEGEVVAVRDKSPGGDNHVYTYGLFEETEDEGDLSGVNCVFPTFRIKTTLGSSEPISGSFVFAFKESLEESSGSDVRERDDRGVSVLDQMEKDIAQIKQIVWVVARSQGSEGEASMNEVHKRLLSSVLSKYTEPDRQERLRRVLEEALKIEAANRRSDPKSKDDNTADTEQTLNRFIEHHFTRMNNEINFYNSRRPRRMKSCARQNTSLELGTVNSQLHYHLKVVRSVEPHPILAKLWLKQATEDLSALRRIWDPDSEAPFTSWAADVAIKVAENCLVSLLLMKDGKTELPFQDDARKRSADPTGTLKELIGKVEASSPEDMSNLKQVLAASVRLSDLHRPSQSQMLTSRSIIAVTPLNSLVEAVEDLHSKVTASIGKI